MVFMLLCCVCRFDITAVAVGHYVNATVFLLLLLLVCVVLLFPVALLSRLSFVVLHFVLRYSLLSCFFLLLLLVLTVLHLRMSLVVLCYHVDGVVTACVCVGVVTVVGVVYCHAYVGLPAGSCRITVCCVVLRVSVVVAAAVRCTVVYTVVVISVIVTFVMVVVVIIVASFVTVVVVVLLLFVVLLLMLLVLYRLLWLASLWL